MFSDLVATLTHVIGRFDNKELAFGIAIGILAAALMAWLYLEFWRQRRWLLPLRRVTGALPKRPFGGNGGATLAEVNNAFALAPALAPLWRDDRDHLVPDPREPDCNPYARNLLDPRISFGLDALPGRGYEHWCATNASVFLTVGLLFTFIGLSAALLKVGGIDGADSVRGHEGRHHRHPRRQFRQVHHLHRRPDRLHRLQPADPPVPGQPARGGGGASRRGAASQRAADVGTAALAAAAHRGQTTAAAGTPDR